MTQSTNNFSIYFQIGAALLLIPLFTFIIEVISFFAGSCTQFWQFPLGFVSGLLCAASMNGMRNFFSYLRPIAAYVILISVILIIICSILQDYTYDGNLYHQNTIAYLLKGWNPYLNTLGVDKLFYCARHYAKVLEIIAAAISATTGLIEAGKAVNGMIIFAAAFLCFDALGFILKNSSWKQKLLAMLMLVCNPVGMTQMLSFYNDFAKYYYILITLCLAARMLKGLNWPVALLFISVIIMAIGTKFNAFFEEGLLIIAVIIWLWALKRRKDALQLVRLSFASLIIGAFILGYHPYVTNVIYEGNPFYPLLGSNTVDIMAGNTPQVFASGNRFSNFLLSVFSFHIPTCDLRIGGFGFFFPIILLLSILALLVYRKYFPKISLVLIGLIAISCFIFEQSWWARYVAQLWLIPCIIAIVLLHIENLPKYGVITRKSIIILAILSGIIGLGVTCYKDAQLSLYRISLFNSLEAKTIKVANNNEQFERHAFEQGFSVIEVPLSSLDSTRSRYFYNEKTCALIEIPAKSK